MTGSAAVIRETGPELDHPSEAVFDESRTYRYLLTRTWDEAWPPITWVMLNPSTADAFTADPTIRRCIGFARSWGAGGIKVVNLFAYRATQPADMRQAADPVGPLNDKFILQACPIPGLAVAAWGAHGGLHGRGAAVTRLLAAAGMRFQCLGTTRDGHPRHPLYAAASTPLTPYEANEVAS